MVRELVQAGAALDVQDKGQNTALMYAAEFGHTEVVQELLHPNGRPGAALDLRNKLGKTALQIAQDHRYKRSKPIMELIAILQEATEAQRRLEASRNDHRVRLLNIANADIEREIRARLPG